MFKLRIVLDNINSNTQLVFSSVCSSSSKINKKMECFSYKGVCGLFSKVF